MKSETGSMYENKVWTLSDLPDDRQVIENKWIFKKKIDADGNVTVYKARLVAKGFRQVQGIDYDETFSPVAMVKSVRIMLAIVAYYDYDVTSPASPCIRIAPVCCMMFIFKGNLKWGCSNPSTK